jgi:hypothetical protein
LRKRAPDPSCHDPISTRSGRHWRLYSSSAIGIANFLGNGTRDLAELEHSVLGGGVRAADSHKADRMGGLYPPSSEFAHLGLRISYSLRYSLPKVPRRTAVSIALLTVLLAGISPDGVCALMCEWHAQAESPRHCSQPSDSMPGMVHHHSARNHRAEAMDGVLVSQSCHMNCVTAERLSVWRKVVPQVMVVRSAAVVLNTTAEVLALDFTAAWGLDSGPPARPPTRAASFSILRV